jgi:hypothetical protein
VLAQRPWIKGELRRLAVRYAKVVKPPARESYTRSEVAVVKDNCCNQAVFDSNLNCETIAASMVPK